MLKDLKLLRIPARVKEYDIEKNLKLLRILAWMKDDDAERPETLKDPSLDEGV